MDLVTTVERLMPTPTAADAGGSGAYGYGARPYDNVTLTDAVVRQVRPWAEYTKAIEQHERVLGREAPAPTVDGRLSPRFVEWMMMLPEGWVTDIVTSRRQALHVLGNGVVPLQAARAVAELTM